MERELVGHIGVDSGQIMLGDPCYLDKWGGHEFTSFDGSHGNTTPTETYDYDGACTATCSKKSHGVLKQGYAAAVASGYGDGYYPVYIERTVDGRISSVTVEFDEEPEVDTCYVCGEEADFDSEMCWSCHDDEEADDEEDEG